MLQPYGNRGICAGCKQLPHLVAEFGRYSVTIRYTIFLPEEIDLS